MVPLSDAQHSLHSHGWMRTLNGIMPINGNSLIPNDCIHECNRHGYTYAGIENGIECCKFSTHSLSSNQLANASSFSMHAQTATGRCAPTPRPFLNPIAIWPAPETTGLQPAADPVACRSSLAAPRSLLHTPIQEETATSCGGATRMSFFQFRYIHLLRIRQRHHRLQNPPVVHFAFELRYDRSQVYHAMSAGRLLVLWHGERERVL